MVSTWAEVTSLTHLHGGPGWELGVCLWSPSTSRDGINRYEVMRRPSRGDRVYHLVSGIDSADPRRRFLYGISRVARGMKEVRERPSSPGEWQDATSYFRIDLAEHHRFEHRLPMEDVERGLADQILQDLENRPKYYPYAPYRDGYRGAQGIYLTLLSDALSEAFDQLVGQPQGSSPDTEAIALEFAEGQRSLREATFFKRNPALRKAALHHHGLTCFVCGFDFGARYGALGEGFIEVHHLNPLAERRAIAGDPTVVTTVADVVPVCANCHRIIHRVRPARSIKDLQQALLPPIA